MSAEVRCTPDPTPLADDSEAADAIPSDEVLEALGVRIGEVRIVVGDVFDSNEASEDKTVYRLVNRLHVNTRDWVVRQQLLFLEGSLYEGRLLEESERILRTHRYLYDAEIEVVDYEGGKVDVEVRTRDVWTLTGGLSFGRAGGENTVRFNLQDFNVFGTGKEIGIQRSSDVDRTSTEVLYRDRNFFGSRARTEIKLADKSDGHRAVLKLERPFYSLDSRWTAGAVVVSDERVERIFDQGEVVDQFRHDSEFFEAYWGLSPGLVDGRSVRWRLGYTYQGNRFSVAEDRPEPLVLPPDRTLSYPWVEVATVRDRFIEARDLDRISRTEDLNLGTRFQARLGLSSTTFGSLEDEALASVSSSRGFKPGTGKLILADANAGARISSGRVNTFLVNGRGRFFWRNWKEHAFFAALEANVAGDLDPEQQLLLGGDNGLRGYPQRFQTGDRRWLVTLEQRFYTSWEPFKLVNVGAAIFFDAGRAWFAGANDPADLGVLRDVGIGLRLSPSRSGRGTLVHLDVAFPLDGTDSIDSVQWLVTTKETF